MKHANLLDAFGQAATYVGGGTAVASGVSIEHIGPIVAMIGVLTGVVVGIGGLAFQVWLGRRRDRREAEYHAARMWELDKNETSEDS